MSDKFEKRDYHDGEEGDDVDAALMTDIEERIAEAVDYPGAPKIPSAIMDMLAEYGEQLPAGFTALADGAGGWTFGQVPDASVISSDVRQGINYAIGVRSPESYQYDARMGQQSGSFTSGRAYSVLEITSQKAARIRLFESEDDRTAETRALCDVSTDDAEEIDGVFVFRFRPQPPVGMSAYREDGFYQCFVLVDHQADVVNGDDNLFEIAFTVLRHDPNTNY